MKNDILQFKILSNNGKFIGDILDCYNFEEYQQYFENNLNVDFDQQEEIIKIIEEAYYFGLAKGTNIKENLKSIIGSQKIDIFNPLI